MAVARRARYLCAVPFLAEGLLHEFDDELVERLLRWAPIHAGAYRAEAVPLPDDRRYRDPGCRTSASRGVADACDPRAALDVRVAPWCRDLRQTAVLKLPSAAAGTESVAPYLLLRHASPPRAAPCNYSLTTVGRGGGGEAVPALRVTSRFAKVPRRGVEPLHPCGRRILSPLRLPVPPPRRAR